MPETKLEDTESPKPQDTESPKPQLPRTTSSEPNAEEITQKEETAARKREWHWANREKVLARKRLSYQANKEQLNARRRE